MLTKRDIVESSIDRSKYFSQSQMKSLRADDYYVSEFAPANIALCKYWGKRNMELNLPTNSSLSISLGESGTKTSIYFSNCDYTQVFFNKQELNPKDSFFCKKILTFINYFQCNNPCPLVIDTTNNIPTAAGLASSASGFAALTKAINRFFQFDLSQKQLSILSRMGSGSACRSIYNGFVEWKMGEEEDGMDSYAIPLEIQWPELCVGVLKISTGLKPISSTEGMIRTKNTSVLYQQWSNQAANDIESIKSAIENKDIEWLGKTAEHNALSMHATMISSWPPLLYWTDKTVEAMHTIWNIRKDGYAVYFTIDAGPNIKLLFLDNITDYVKSLFAEIEIIKPFSGVSTDF